MRNALKSAAIIVAVGTALAVSGLANAATVAIDFGNVSVGYADGYRDTNNGSVSYTHLDVYKRQVYIILGILYESFIHPLTILSGLPSAAVGALLSLIHI